MYTLEAIAIRLEAIPSRLEAITLVTRPAMQEPLALYFWMVPTFDLILSPQSLRSEPESVIGEDGRSDLNDFETSSADLLRGAGCCKQSTPRESNCCTPKARQTASKQSTPNKKTPNREDFGECRSSVCHPGQKASHWPRLLTAEAFTFSPRSKLLSSDHRRPQLLCDHPRVLWRLSACPKARLSGLGVPGVTSNGVVWLVPSGELSSWAPLSFLLSSAPHTCDPWYIHFYF